MPILQRCQWLARSVDILYNKTTHCDAARMYVYMLQNVHSPKLVSCNQQACYLEKSDAVSRDILTWRWASQLRVVGAAVDSIIGCEILGSIAKLEQ